MVKGCVGEYREWLCWADLGSLLLLLIIFMDNRSSGIFLRVKVPLGLCILPADDFTRDTAAEDTLETKDIFLANRIIQRVMYYFMDSLELNTLLMNNAFRPWPFVIAIVST